MEPKPVMVIRDASPLVLQGAREIRQGMRLQDRNIDVSVRLENTPGHGDFSGNSASGGDGGRYGEIDQFDSQASCHRIISGRREGLPGILPKMAGLADTDLSRPRQQGFAQSFNHFHAAVGSDYLF